MKYYIFAYLCDENIDAVQRGKSVLTQHLISMIPICDTMVNTQYYKLYQIQSFRKKSIQPTILLTVK